VTIALALGALLLTLPSAHLDALKAAGAFSGEAIGGVQTFVEKLKGNVVWLGITMAGLVIAVIALLFVTGHSRAQDIAIRAVVGLMILASISGIVA
jgi:hypothetical protein